MVIRKIFINLYKKETETSVYLQLSTNTQLNLVKNLKIETKINQLKHDKFRPMSVSLLVD